MIGPGDGRGIDRSADRGVPMTPQLALRVAVIGSVALLMFAIIFFRLWFLQVLSGSSYVAQAQTNVVRKIPVLAPRGEIVDRTGNVLVSSSPVPAIMITPTDLPVPFTLSTLDDLATGKGLPAKDVVLFNNLARLLHISTAPLHQKCHIYGKRPPKGPGGYYVLAEIPCEVAQSVSDAGSFQNVTVETNASPDLQAYLLERQLQFPGVTAQTEYVRQYPLGGSGAQIFGTVQPLTLAEETQKHFKDVQHYDRVGQSGLEYTYNDDLQGTDGYEAVKVSAQGAFEGYGAEHAPQTGQTLQTSLSAPLERAGQQALETSIASNAGADGGAFVAMDPDNGQILAMGSAPTYDPSVFTHPLSQTQADAIYKNPLDPLFNRAIQGAGPTGSTFKVITATAGLESGAWSLGESFDDTGQMCFTGGLCVHNAGHMVGGVMDITRAIEISDDVFFFNLGRILNVDPTAHPNGGALQKWAHAFGIGRSTGIDLPASVNGTLPTPAWRAARNKLELECENATGPFAGKPKHPASQGGCGIADGNPWTVGDNSFLGVGQGDVQVTPMQLAVAYAALANDGNIVTPHLGMDIRDANGTVVQRIDPGVRRHLNLNPAYRAAILQGLHEAAQSSGGTSYDVMGNFPLPVYGKTGTAQYSGQNDYAWYACFVPGSATRKPIVIVVTVERGGFGDIAAAPVARQMLNQWFLGHAGAYKAGTGQTL